MTLIRLTICVVGVYASFLAWALVQEKLSTTTYPGPEPNRFRSVLFLNTVQSTFSATSGFLYLLSKWRKGQSLRSLLGLEGISYSPPSRAPAKRLENGSSTPVSPSPAPLARPTATLLGRYLYSSVLVSLASPFGFASLSHISYPTMILGKSCKLVPVLLMNVLIYRRRFASHKYLVVGMVTAGISLFMLYQPVKPGKGKGGKEDSWIGLGLLLINLLLDGMVNSSQDEVFARFKGVRGEHMMVFMNLFATILTTAAIVFPFPSIPFLSPSTSASSASSASELTTALRFISTHPLVLRDILLYSLCGATGQLFIYHTLEHFGSLTLVTITVTRKLGTMLLSVFVFNHELALGQWVGVAVVFAGIAVEAEVKMREGRLKKMAREEEKLKLKDA